MVNICIQFGNFYATGQIFIAVNCQRLKKNSALWSHCSLPRARSANANSLKLFTNCNHIKVVKAIFGKTCVKAVACFDKLIRREETFNLGRYGLLLNCFALTGKLQPILDAGLRAIIVYRFVPLTNENQCYNVYNINQRN